MPSLLVVTGPPGAGKSTVAAQIAQRQEPSALVDGDAFFAFVVGGAVPWLPGSEAQNQVVGSAAAAATAAFVSGGYHTVYDGVLGPWSLRPFCIAGGVTALDYAVLLPSEAVCVARVAHRRDHGFTGEAATRKMHREFVAAAMEERHVLVTDHLDAEETAAEVLRRRDERLLRHVVTDVP